MSFKLQLGVNEATNSQYHSDKAWLSSSSFKKVLDDPAKYYKEEVLGAKEQEAKKEYFDDGSLMHSLILEPHLVDKEYAFFEGMRKAGAEYQAFVAANPGKTIISKSQKTRAQLWYDTYKRNKKAVELIGEGGLSEHTVCLEYKGVQVKVRADRINVEKGIIVDVKTSSFPVDKDSAIFTNEKWKYPFSAAMYSLVFEKFYKRPFEFYWLYIAKTDADCAVYRMSQATRKQGELEFHKAHTLYKNCLATGKWIKPETQTHFDDEIEEI